MKRDYKAPEVTTGSKWYVWGRHYEVVGLYEHPSNEEGAPPTIPTARLCPLNSEGERIKTKSMLLVPAWRVSYYGEPSVAFSARDIIEIEEKTGG